LSKFFEKLNQSLPPAGEREGGFTITHVTDASGNVVNEYNFDAWGRRRNFTDWSYTVAAQTDLLPDRGFTGHEYLPWFKLYNMNGRLYDPVVGRFLEPDPVVQDASSTQNLNRYSYCLNNPLKYTDPSGYRRAIVPGEDELWIDPYYKNPNGGRGTGGGHSHSGFGAPGFGNNGTGLNGMYYDWYSNTYRNTSGDNVDFSMFYNNAVIPNAERNISVDFYLYLGRGNWQDNRTALVRNPYGNVAAYAYFSYEGSYGVKTLPWSGNLPLSQDDGPSKISSGLNNSSFLLDGFNMSTAQMLVSEYRRGADVAEIAKSMKAVSRLGKVSVGLNVAAVGYDITSGNIHTSTVTDAAMIGVGIVVGVAFGPITAGVIGLTYGAVMIIGGQDAINNAFDGSWNLQINKSINDLYRR
jgi:RHS repeat-associated protein